MKVFSVLDSRGTLFVLEEVPPDFVGVLRNPDDSENTLFFALAHQEILRNEAVATAEDEAMIRDFIEEQARRHGDHVSVVQRIEVRLFVLLV